MAQDPDRSPPRPLDNSQPTLTKELLAKYLAGDFAAEERLFARFRASLLKRAQRHPRMRPLLRECAPDDVVQEVFRRALASGMLTRFEDQGRGSLDAALAKVLDNTLVDMARRMAAQKRGGASARVDSGTGEVTTGLDRMPSDDTTPTSRARSKELVELVRRTLEPREIEVWTAIELEGLDSAELAKRLGTTPSAARGVLFRAQRKLVQALGAELDGGETRSSHQPT